MSITAWDIKEAAFSSDVKDVEELILTNKGATDVGALSQAVNLRSLSLAFNSLASLSGLACLARLQSLNVSHNQLASLKGLHALSCLVTLNASHNKIVSLAPLSGLVALADLWLQNNSVGAPGELRVLAALPGLQRLAIANNPVAKALPADHVRLVALRLCAGLRVIDGRPVEAADRTASERLDLDELLSAWPPAPGSAPAATPTLGSLGLLSSRPGSGSSAPLESGRGANGARPGRTAGRSSNGAAHSLPESRLPAAGTRRKNRSNSYDSVASSATSGQGSPHNPDPDGGQLQGGAAGDPSADDAIAAALEAVASFSSTSSSRSGSRLLRSGSNRRPPLSGGVLRPAAQLQGTQFQAVVDALPRFDASKLPARYNGAPAKPRAPPPVIVKPPPDAHLVDYEAKYPAQRGGGRAVVVRRDGSAAAFWPGGDMAVTVDTDYSEVVAAPEGGDGGEEDGGGGGRTTAAGPSYKIMVMYRAGGVAVSWDAVGGFVQYPSGGLMLMYSRTTGSGTCYSPSGDITRRWRDLDAVAGSAPPPVAIPLPYPLAASSTPAPPPPPPPAHIDMQLDPHLGVRFLSASHTLELYLSCETVRYRFRCGRNTPGDAWEPPPGRGDGGSGPASRAQTAPYDSQPSTPAGAARPPVIGEGRGCDGEGGGEALLPPPSFLRNLARQGGAGTHRPVGAAAAAKQASLAAGGGPAGAATTAAAAGEALVGIASITAGLQALDEGLQAWLARDSLAKMSGPTAAPPLDLASSSSGAPANKPPAAPSPAKGRRIGGGSGVSAARALAAEAVEPVAAAAAAAEARVTSSGANVTGGSGSGKAAGGGAGGDVDATGPDTGDGDVDAGGGGSKGIDSDVAAHLAAARRLAADSLAAAMAAASAVAAIGSK